MVGGLVAAVLVEEDLVGVEEVLVVEAVVQH